LPHSYNFTCCSTFADTFV